MAAALGAAPSTSCRRRGDVGAHFQPQRESACSAASVVSSGHTSCSSWTCRRTAGTQACCCWCHWLRVGARHCAHLAAALSLLELLEELALQLHALLDDALLVVGELPLVQLLEQVVGAASAERAEHDGSARAAPPRAPRCRHQRASPLALNLRVALMEEGGERRGLPPICRALLRIGHRRLLRSCGVGGHSSSSSSWWWSSAVPLEVLALSAGRRREQPLVRARGGGRHRGHVCCCEWPAQH